MKIKKKHSQKKFFLVKKTIDFHRIIPPEKVKKRHETLAKNDAIMKKMLRCFGK